MNINSLNSAFDLHKNEEMFNAVKMAFEVYARKNKIVDVEFNEETKEYTDANTNTAFNLFVVSVCAVGNGIAQEWIAEQQKQLDAVANAERIAFQQQRQELWKETAVAIASCTVSDIKMMYAYTDAAVEGFDKRFGK